MKKAVRPRAKDEALQVGCSQESKRRKYGRSNLSLVQTEKRFEMVMEESGEDVDG